MKIVKKFLYQVFCIFMGLVVIFPVIYAICISFMDAGEILSTSTHVIPQKITF